MTFMYRGLNDDLIARSNTTDTNWSITVTGQVEPGPACNKWYNSWAECRGVRARVSTNTGLFSLPGVPLHGGSNELVVTVTDISGNTYTTNRWNKKQAAEYFLHDGNGDAKWSPIRGFGQDTKIPPKPACAEHGRRADLLHVRQSCGHEKAQKSQTTQEFATFVHFCGCMVYVNALIGLHRPLDC